MPFEENEISEKSQGGTEISKRSIDKLIPKELSDNFQIIASRPRDLQEDKIRILYCHDLSEDPEVAKLRDKSYRDKFHKIVFVSNWQLQEYCNKLNIPMDGKLQVIENPIEPLERHENKADKINIVYFSTPQRGLEILVPVFDKLLETENNIHLNVFSSFKIYGWEDMDKKYQPLYDKIKSNPSMSYFGFTDQEDLRRSISEADILAYPCIWKETSCRVLIESMSAGLLCIHPNYGALPDTSGGLTMSYQYESDYNTHANMFYSQLKHAVSIVRQPDLQTYLRFVKAYADSRYNLNKISDLWSDLLKNLLLRYPTTESRALPKVNHPVFSYKS